MNELDKILPLVSERDAYKLWVSSGAKDFLGMSSEYRARAQRAADVRNLVAWLRAEAVEREQRLSINKGYDLAASSIRVRADRLEAMLNTAEKR